MRRRDVLRALIATSGGAVLGCDPPVRRPSIPPLHPGSARAAPWSSASAPAAPAEAPAIVTAEAARPQIPYGVQSGDVTSNSAVLWSRADRPSRMIVEWSPDEAFAGGAIVEGPVATPDADYTVHFDLGGLPPGRRIAYRVTFADLDTGRARSEPVLGSLTTAPDKGGDVHFLWSGDTAGQGWGINLAWGGMKIYEAMRRMRPDFFIHCGDLIYADMPILPEVTLPDGSIWQNVVTPEKSKVAETLAEFRGHHAYNLLDRNVRRFNAEVASFVMWDDHEVYDNWFPGKILDRDPRYTEKRIDVLAERARRAMFEYTPMRPPAPGRVYRNYRWGPSLEVILLDERSHRGPNGDNRGSVAGAEAAFLGADQVRWLEETLARSTATWKILASDQPLGLVVGDGVRGGVKHFDAWANGSGPPLGREIELARVLGFIEAHKIQNVVWLTADVHYAAAHHYHPSRAEFARFLPFWEFVAGPLHASTYGPNALDPTFGPEVRWSSPPSGKHRRGPADGGQYFGSVRIDGKSLVMTVRLYDLTGTKLFEIDLPPAK
jgi:alkaline phosphatase D